ncbi:HAD hydrolase-like protein [Candidatus Woesearchaeota archaeon]|nr:HAD hydrolase-like protein [Candidatus Woesearchaeota archaeon]
MIKVIIFDFRDTITNVKFSYLNRNNYLWNYCINYCKVESIFNQKLQDARNKVIEEHTANNTISDWDSLVFETLFKNNNYNFSEEQKKKLYPILEDIFITRVKTFQDALFLLNYCRNNNIKTGLTIDGTKQRENKILDTHNLRQYFDAISISEEVGKNKFTDAVLVDCINKLKQKTNFTPEEVLVIGDRIDKDIIHAKKHNLKTALLQREDGRYAQQNQALLEEYKPDFIIKSLTEIQVLLEKEARLKK